MIPLSKHVTRNDNLIVEAGINGWKTIFLNEVYQSALESKNFKNVFRLCTAEKSLNFRFTYKNLQKLKCGFYFFDPRSLQGSLLKKIFHTIKLIVIFKRLNITAISVLTDPSLRLNRLISIALTTNSGILVTFMDISNVSQYFYKCKVISPMLPPISRTTRLEIENLNVKPRDLLLEDRLIIGIKGDLYSSRLKSISALKNGIMERKLNFEVRVTPKDNNLSSELYWKELLNFDLVFTTTKQGINELNSQGNLPYKADFTNVNQIVFRITEALVSNRVLICENAPGLNQLFDTSSDLIVYEEIDDLLDKLEFYYLNREALLSLRNTGNARILKYLDLDFFWGTIKSALT